MEALLFENAPWRFDAACRTIDASLGEIFFSDELQHISQAKAICAECPVMAECLEGAIARREPWGVWGGQLFRNGKVLTSKRRRGRQAKVPRHEDEFLQVPVPVHLRERLRSA